MPLGLLTASPEDLYILMGLGSLYAIAFFLPTSIDSIHRSITGRQTSAAMAAQSSPLRRWKRFFGAFDSVDAAIETADPDLCRDSLRRARGDIFEGLCKTADDGKAETLCGVLDGLMAESSRRCG
ncbi:hypothetical protein ZWY2020_001618 [Hordeum vulgare]|nr:hypothetical protein ZWY2020_001618 [Hordeum vulgare]